MDWFDMVADLLTDLVPGIWRRVRRRRRDIAAEPAAKRGNT